MYFDYNNYILQLFKTCAIQVLKGMISKTGFATTYLINILSINCNIRFT